MSCSYCETDLLYLDLIISIVYNLSSYELQNKPIMGSLILLIKKSTKIISKCSINISFKCMFYVKVESHHLP